MLSRSTALFRLLAPAVLTAGVIVPLSAGVASAAQPICLSGTLQFDFLSAEGGIPKPTLTRGACNVSVELWGRETSAETDHKLNADTRLTGAADGSFNLCHTPVTTTSTDRLFVRVSASVALGVVKPATAARSWHAFDTVNLLWSRRVNSTTPCCV